MKNPWAAIEAYSNEEKKADSDFERLVMKRLIDAGFRVKAQWQVGYYRIDLVVEGDGKRLAIECDGDRYHPIEKLEADLARQTVLERLGWQFARIRGSVFYRYPDEAMRAVFEALDKLGIPAVGQAAENRSDDWTLVNELEELRTSGEEYDDSTSRDNADADSTTNGFEEQDSGNTAGFSHEETEKEPGLGLASLSPHPSLPEILGALGGSARIDQLMRAWINARGYKRAGRIVKSAFDIELAANVRNKTVIQDNNIVILP
jgi:very-short-patch-repair endonuclease